ncbi:type 1 glutamine amidotransferase [Xenorhabdus innexi]|uniref:GMP synthase n=1 Tax=Xenorhabdus innexi TaxID=290109 RepID=A0A1N6MV48_9GAMM|nr:type 1 glutamine amidotransferase [Xenorhabdus innexi]PHM33262.1 GMP synthase [Xenorhabdus innexi]SIP72654.1 putative glutamine amidotransferase-like protein yfeJ [Xenorhabdus innexi]
MRIHFVVHEDFEAPGAYEDWAKARGYQTTFSRVYLGEQLPDSIEEIDFLIVMGGPQSPATTLADCPYFDAAAEKQLIVKAATSGKIVVGVCLGAQLIGDALGGTFEYSPEKEIGKFPIMLTEAGLKNDHFAHFGKILEVGHWHGDMPGLTPEAKIIAISEGCPRQIIEYQNLVYAFQCHMELTPELVELLIQNSEKDLNKADEYKFVQTPEILRTHDYSEMNKKLFVFLDKLTEQYRVMN